MQNRPRRAKATPASGYFAGMKDMAGSPRSEPDVVVGNTSPAR